MSLILRNTKGSRLTINEMDGNFSYLENLALAGLTTSVVVEEKTYSEWSTIKQNGGLTPGSYIKITDRADDGIILFCNGTNSFGADGYGHFINADYQYDGDYSNIDGGIFNGVWTRDLESVWISYYADNQYSIQLSNVDNMNPGDYMHLLDNVGATASTGIITSVNSVTGVIVYRLSSGDISEAITAVDITTQTSMSLISYNVYTATISIDDSVYSNDGAFGIVTAVSTNQIYVSTESGNFYSSSVIYKGNLTFSAQINHVDTSSLVNNSIVISYENHYLVTNYLLFNGNQPNSNSAAYTYLDRLRGNGYIYEWDSITYDFVEDIIYWRRDKRGNVIPYYRCDFQWGADNINNCVLSSLTTTILLYNNTANISGNISGRNGFMVIVESSGNIFFNETGKNAEFYIINCHNNVSIFLNGVDNYIDIEYNTGNIQVHVEGFSSEITMYNQSGDIKAYIYDNSTISANYNTGDIYASYTNNAHINHDYNHGDIEYAEFKDNYGDEVGYIVLDETVSIFKDICYAPTAAILQMAGSSSLIPNFTYHVTDSEGPVTTYGLIESEFKVPTYNTDEYVKMKSISKNKFENISFRSWKVPQKAPVWNTTLTFTYSIFEGNPEYETVVPFNQSGCLNAIVTYGGWIWINVTGEWGSNENMTTLSNDWIRINKGPTQNSESLPYAWWLIAQHYYKQEISEVIWKNGVFEWIKDSNSNEIDFYLLQDSFYYNAYSTYSELKSLDFIQFAQDGIFANKGQIIVNNYTDSAQTGWYSSPTHSYNAHIYNNTGNIGLINNNTIVSGGEISGNVLGAYASVTNCFLSSSIIRLNIFDPVAFIAYSYFTDNIIASNFFYNGSEQPDMDLNVSGIYGATGTAINNCTINKSIMVNLRAQLTDCSIDNCFIGNFYGGMHNCDIKKLGLDFNNITDYWDNKIYTPYYSTFDTTISMGSSPSVIDLQNYSFVGTVYLNGISGTYSVSEIYNYYSTLIPLKIIPNPAIKINFIGTTVYTLNYNSSGFALPTSSISINGDTYDYIIFERNLSGILCQTDAMNYV